MNCFGMFIHSYIYEHVQKPLIRGAEDINTQILEIGRLIKICSGKVHIGKHFVWCNSYSE